MTTILRQQDSLKLTPQQADSLATMNQWYMTRLDSIWTPVSKYLADLPKDYDHGAAYGRYLSARRATIDLLVRLGPQVKRLLTPEQQRKLPAFVASYLEPRYLASIRSGTQLFTSGAMTLPGLQTGTVAAMAGMGGGGQVTEIGIRP